MDENEDREQRLHDRRMEIAARNQQNAIDAARYRKLRRASLIEGRVASENPNAEVADWEMELAIAETEKDYDACVDALPPGVVGSPE